MAADGMALTNHDHQTRVGILTGEETVRSSVKTLLHRARWWRFAVVCQQTSVSRCGLSAAELPCDSPRAKLTGVVDCHCLSCVAGCLLTGQTDVGFALQTC